MPELEQKSFQKRLVAYKVRISDILNRNFAKDELSAGYINLNGVSISRVNIIATVVYKSEGSGYAGVVIDDGTGKISLRSFENSTSFSKIDVGDAVLVVGKIREFDNEKYIVAEILKKMGNAEWVKVRRVDLDNNRPSDDNTKITSKGAVEEPVDGIGEEIYKLIKTLDTGEGASIDDVVVSSNNNKAESIIKRLLENGDIFEITPGKLKVLE